MITDHTTIMINHDHKKLNQESGIYRKGGKSMTLIKFMVIIITNHDQQIMIINPTKEEPSHDFDQNHDCD